jgi:hypothetical protein
MKSIKKLALLLIAFLMAYASAEGQNGKVRGRIFDVSTNEPLPFANIIVSGTSIGTTSDLDGNFIITGLEPGFIRLSASTIGYQDKITEEFQVTNAVTAFIDVPMQATQVELEAVVVKSSAFTERDLESPLSVRTLGSMEIEKEPGANRDISRVIQNLPGVSSSVSFRNDVIVRGGGPSENSFYLEDVEIPTINHFSTQGASGGPVGIINADFLREVQLYSGAFPASRGNALSSVLEMKMKNGNAEKLVLRGTLGASEVGLTLEGPIGKKSTFIVSARRSYLQFLFSLLELPFLPTYNDFQFKYRILFDDKNVLTFIGLGAIDQFELNTGLKNPTEEQAYFLSSIPVNEQWSYTIGGVYKHFGSRGSHTLVLSRNYLDNRATKYKDNDKSDPENKQLEYTSSEAENKLRYEYDISLSNFKLNYGAGLQYAKYTNETFQRTFTDQVGVIDYSTSLPLWSWNIFGQVSRGFVRDRLNLSLGLRADANNYSSSMNNLIDQLSPRFSASYLFTDKWLVNFNTGRYYQRPPYTSLGFRDNNGELVNKSNGLKYIQADHIIAGLEFLPNENTMLSLEGFYKIYNNYPFSVTDSISLASKGGDFGVFGAEEVVSTNKGNTYGAELYYRGKIFWDISMMVSYTYVRSKFDDKNGIDIPSAWDNQHILNITGRKAFKKNWFFGFRWRYVGGPPYTPWDIEKSSIRLAWDAQGAGYLDFNQFNTLRLNQFHQLDIRIDKSYFFKKWSLTVYLDIQNLYNYKGEQAPNLVQQLDQDGNPVIYINPEDGIERYQLKLLSSEAGTVLPTIGIIVEI